jgi:LysR family nitrogen assimilation transcriptional regulator
MDIRQLRYFATVAELGSFTKAAARLSVAQPALSRQVKQLEERIGLELLSRQGRRIRLTEAGEVLVRHARTIQRDFERLVEDMQARKDTPTGRVIFGVPPSLADIVVPPVVRRMADEYPAITIQVAEGISPVLAQWLQDNQIDLAVLGLVADPEAAKARGLQEEVLTSEEMVVVEKTNGASPHVYSRAMLEAKPLVVSRLFEAVVRGALHIPDLSLKISLAIDSMLALKAMVLAGQAATILPVSVLREQLHEGTVTASTITADGVRRHVTLAWPHFRQSTQATEAVANVIRTEIERLRRLGTFSWNPPNPSARLRFSRPAERAGLSRKPA